MALPQDDRLLRIYGAPFSADDVMLTSLSGHEAMSRLYSFQLEFLSQQTSLKAADLIGKRMKIEIASDHHDGEIRYVNGYLNRFSVGVLVSEEDKQLQVRSYRAELVPWLWFLTQTARCFVYFPESEDKSIYDIISAVFDRAQAELHIDPKVELKGIDDLKSRKVKHCVQYRETDFNFLSRIMEQYGVYYYFTQDDGEHTLVLSMDKNYPTSSQSSIKFPHQSMAGRGTADHIRSWEHAYEFVSGKWAHTDYDFENPSDALMAKSGRVSAQHPDADNYEIYDFPGEYSTVAEGTTDARIRQEEEEVPHDSVQASGRCRALMPGHTFKLEKRQDGTLDAEVDSYLVTSIQHSVSQPGPIGGNDSHAGYTNSFTCVPDSVQFRAARRTPKPVVSGIQTAVVVGPAGEEIHTDKYGRIKACFHWDREDADRDGNGRTKADKGEDFFCWVRVAQNMAGKKWGFMAIPRIGQEVVVDFIEGDPDRPLVVGSVYNAEQMPHYDLDEHKTRTYIKTNSSPGGDGFNELFFEDKADEERIFIHAEKNFDQRIKNHSTEHIGGNQHLIVGRDEAETGGEVEIDIEHKLKRSVGDKGIEFTNEGDELKLTEGSQHLTVSGDWNSKANNISSEAAMEVHSKSGMNYAIESGMGVHIKGGLKVVVEAGLSLTLKVGGNHVTIDPSGVTVKGTMVVLEGGVTRINSGPGSPANAGAGCSPQSPTEPEKAEPNEAHREQTGQASNV